MGAKHTTERERELFQFLVNSGLSMRKAARLTGRTAGTISEHIGKSDTVMMNAHCDSKYMSEELMFQILDKHAQGMSCSEIAKEVNRPHGTVYKVIFRVYPKHQKAYAKWLETQEQQKESPVHVTPAALQAIRDARMRGQNQNEQQESPSLVMEVQTVEPQKQDEPEQPSIDWQAKWCEAQIQIADLRETNDILKGYVRLLHSMSDR